ncbi:MAG: hypothetical protein ACP5KB_06285 [Thermoprotei archaeon]
MSRAKETYFCLRLVEYTSIPLTLCSILYLLSGYGIISPVFSLVGLTYTISVKIHTLPLLRLVTVILAILHLYGGVVVISSRHVRSWKRRRLIKSFTLAMVSMFLFLIALSELKMLLT